MSLAVERRNAEDSISLEGDPCERLCDEETQRAIRKAVSNLPRVLGGAMWLRIVCGLSLREAAQKAGCSCDAMKKRLQRAKHMLREANASDTYHPDE